MPSFHRLFCGNLTTCDHLRPPEHTQDQQASLWWWFCGEQRQIMIRRPSTHGENRRSLVLRFMCQSSQTADDFVHFVHFWSPKHSPESTTKSVLHVQSKSLRHRCKSTAGKDADEGAPGWSFQPRKLQNFAAEYYTINGNTFDWKSYQKQRKSVYHTIIVSLNRSERCSKC